MPRFSPTSRDRLKTCHPDLVAVFEEVVKHVDCTILEGHRNREDQERAVAVGTSRLPWPESKHNKQPSLAVDVAPYPIDWNNLERFYYFAGYVLGTAQQMGVGLRSGLDWDQDWETTDQILVDGPHFELVDPGGDP